MKDGMMRLILGFLLLTLSVGSLWAEEAQMEPRKCFTPAQTREISNRLKLADPFKILKNIAISIKAEPLRNQLCQWGKIYVYEMTFLPPNGKVMRPYVNATDGTPLNRRQASPPVAREPEAP